MVNAKLHVICGNCGCADMLEHEIDRDHIIINEGEQDEAKVDECIISCRNCATLHFLSSVLPMRARKPTNEH